MLIGVLRLQGRALSGSSRMVAATEATSIRIVQVVRSNQTVWHVMGRFEGQHSFDTLLAECFQPEHAKWIAKAFHTEMNDVRRVAGSTSSGGTSGSRPFFLRLILR